MAPDLEWPKARVRDRSSSPALGWPAIVGLIVAFLALRRGDPFALFGGVALLVFGASQLLRPGLSSLPFRDARVFVTGGKLTIDGRPIDVARVFRSEAIEGPTLFIEAGRSSSVSVLCPTPDDRRALLRALGQPTSAPFVFLYFPWFTPVFSGATVFFGFGTVAGRLFHLLPPELGWRPLWLVNVITFMFVFLHRMEVTADELRVAREVVPLRTIHRVDTENSSTGVPIWLVVQHEFGMIRVLIPNRLAAPTARAIEKCVKRATRSPREK